jgi:hypothetical protein
VPSWAQNASFHGTGSRHLPSIIFQDFMPAWSFFPVQQTFKRPQSAPPMTAANPTQPIVLNRSHRDTQPSTGQRAQARQTAAARSIFWAKLGPVCAGLCHFGPKWFFWFFLCRFVPLWFFLCRFGFFCATLCRFGFFVPLWFFLCHFVPVWGTFG